MSLGHFDGLITITIYCKFVEFITTFERLLKHIKCKNIMRSYNGTLKGLTHHLV